MRNKRIYKIALTGLFAALATIAFTIESLFPPIILPGARMGISNVFILLSTITLGVGSGFATLIIKIVLGSLFSGNLSSMLFSLPAGIVSLSIETVLIFAVKNISIPAVSVAGAVVNTTLQNTVFCLVTKTAEYLCYLPYLALISAVTGLIVGFAVYLAVKKLPEKLFAEVNI